MIKEEVAYRLADEFLKEYKKTKPYPLYSLRTVDKSKWWVHFERASGYRCKEGWNPETHIKCCFDKFGPVLPFRIYGKKAEEAWEELHDNYDKVNRNDFLTQMLGTYKIMKKEFGGYDTDFYKKKLLFIKRKSYSVHFLSLSKTFRELNREENIYDEEELNNKRLVVSRNKKVIKKMKELFGEDFYESIS